MRSTIKLATCLLAAVAIGSHAGTIFQADFNASAPGAITSTTTLNDGTTVGSWSFENATNGYCGGISLGSDRAAAFAHHSGGIANMTILDSPGTSVTNFGVAEVVDPTLPGVTKVIANLSEPGTFSGGTVATVKFDWGMFGTSSSGAFKHSYVRGLSSTGQELFELLFVNGSANTTRTIFVRGIDDDSITLISASNGTPEGTEILTNILSTSNRTNLDGTPSAMLAVTISIDNGNVTYALEQSGGPSVTTNGFALNTPAATDIATLEFCEIWNSGVDGQNKGFWLDNVKVTSVNASDVLAPDTLTVTATGTSNQLALEWPAGQNAASYRIYRTQTSGVYDTTPYATVTAPTINYNDNVATNFTTFYYKVTSVSASSVETAGSSPEASGAAYNASDTTPPAAPTISTTVRGSRVILEWNENTEIDFVSYKISRATNIGGPYTELATGFTDTIYRDNALAVGLTYYYQVAAVDFVGNEGVGTAPATPEAATTAYKSNIYFVDNSGVVYGFTSMNVDDGISIFGQGTMTNGIPVLTNATYGTYQALTPDPLGTLYGITLAGDVVSWSSVDSWLNLDTPTVESTGLYNPSNDQEVHDAGFNRASGGYYVVRESATVPPDGDVFLYPDIESFINNTNATNLSANVSQRYDANLINFYYSEEDAPVTTSNGEPGANYIDCNAVGHLNGFVNLNQYVQNTNNREFQILNFCPTARCAFAVIKTPVTNVADIAVESSGGNVVVSWPAETYGTYTLQSKSSLVSGTWMDEINVYSTSTNAVSITNATEAVKFYRVKLLEQ